MSDWGWEEEGFICPICNSDDMVMPSGPTKSPILIIAEYPGWEEIKKGRPLVGSTGNVLKAELRYLGIDMKRIRLANLWQHPKNDNAGCLTRGAKQVISEARHKKLILLIGSETVKYFCDLPVSEVTGLLVKSPYLSAPEIMACVQPATVFHQGIGELRNSLQKFGKLADKLL